MAMRIECDEEVRVGDVVEGALERRAGDGRHASVRLASGESVWLAHPPAGLTEGARARIEIERLALPDSGRRKRARARVVDIGIPLRRGPSLAERIAASGLPVRCIDWREADAFADHGWDEGLEQALSGVVPFAGGTLQLAATPAMTVIDVDGWLAPLPLALAAAGAVGALLERFGIGGSIAIDFPTLRGKADRQAIAVAMDAALCSPFERTAMNGFGLMQLVGSRPRPAFNEVVGHRLAPIAARLLLGRIARSPGCGPTGIVAHPAIARELAAMPAALKELAALRGGAISLRPDSDCAIWAGYGEACG